MGASDTCDAKKFQADLLRSFQVLNGVCQDSRDRLTDKGMRLHRELTDALFGSEQRLSLSSSRSTSVLQRERDTLIMQLQLFRQSVVSELIEYAASMRKEIQAQCAAESLAAEELCTTNLNTLTEELAQAQAGLDELNCRFSKLLTAGQETQSTATKGQTVKKPICTSEYVHQLIVQHQELTKARLSEATQALEVSRAERTALVQSVANLLRSREACAYKTEGALLDGDSSVDLSTLDQAFEETACGRRKIAEVVVEIHQGKLADLLQELRLETEQLTVSHQARVLAICTQLETAGNELEEEFSVKIQQLTQRAEETLRTERLSLQQIHDELSQRLNDRSVEAIELRLLSVSQQAILQGEALCRGLSEDFSTKIHEQLSALDADKKQMLEQIDSMAKAYSDRLENHVSSVESQLQQIRLHAESLPEQTRNWIDSMRFFADFDSAGSASSKELS